jgi:hypothetical protein
MFSNLEIIVMARMEGLREEAERVRLIRLALQGKSSRMGEAKRRMTDLPGLVLHWWDSLTQHRPVSKQEISTGV